MDLNQHYHSHILRSPNPQLQPFREIAALGLLPTYEVQGRYFTLSNIRPNLPENLVQHMCFIAKLEGFIYIPATQPTQQQKGTQNEPNQVYYAHQPAVA